MSEPAPAPAAAVVIVSFRTGPLLLASIDSALAAAGVGPVVVVDNGNPPDMEAALDARGAAEPRLTILRGHGNVGFARACNLGARAAVGAGWLLFLNPDAALDPGSVLALREAGEERKRPWVAGARIEHLDGREQRGGRRKAPTLARAFGALLGGVADKMHLEHAAEPDRPVTVEAVSGACVMMRADDFASLGGFDEAYFLHVEDLDLCARAIRAGGEVVFVPAARARHAGRTSEASSLFVEWCKGRGLARYLVRFAPNPIERLLAILLGPAVVGAALARTVVGRRRGVSSNIDNSL